MRGGAREERAALAVTTGTEREEGAMDRAVTFVAGILGCFFGISPAAAWCSWLCGVVTDYWTRRREHPSVREG